MPFMFSFPGSTDRGSAGPAGRDDGSRTRERTIVRKDDASNDETGTSPCRRHEHAAFVSDADTRAGTDRTSVRYIDAALLRRGASLGRITVELSRTVPSPAL
jgi:hypothetical protein